MSNLLSIETLVAIRERDAARAELERLRGLVREYFRAYDAPLNTDEKWDALIAAEAALRQAVKPVEDK